MARESSKGPRPEAGEITRKPMNLGGRRVRMASEAGVMHTAIEVSGSEKRDGKSVGLRMDYSPYRK